MPFRIRTEEVASILKKEIEDYEGAFHMEEVGTILEVGDGIARIYGLQNAVAGEMLQFPGDVFGLVFNLEESSVGAVVLGDYLKLREGDEVRRTRRVVAVPVGNEMLGRVVDPLGRPMDEKGPIKADAHRPIELVASGIAARQPVNQPLQTGIKAIDAMIPIGRGQRELIIGDRSTGKTAIAIDAIINQKHENVICVYVAIGQKASTVAGVVQRLREAGALDYTVVVCATSSDPAPMQYVAPYSGCTIAEYFMFDHDRDTLVIYDDLTKQAQAYRQLSLLLRRPPGREAYPGDVFYLHSRLLERACKLKDLWVIVPKDAPEGARDGLDGVVYERPEGRDVAELVIKGFPTEGKKAYEVREIPTAGDRAGRYGIFQKGHPAPVPHMTFDGAADADKFFRGRADKDKVEIRRKRPSGGSLTALPIIETQEGEVSAYIPTNVISITDGQIYLEPNLFLQGIRPAINVGISVSRVGGKAQIDAMKQVAKSLRLDLAQYWELEAFAQLGTELDKFSQQRLDRGKRLVELLKQDQYQPMGVEEQVISIFAGNRGYLDDLPLDKVKDFEARLVAYVRDVHSEVPQAIKQDKVVSKETERDLDVIVSDFKRAFVEGRAPDPRLARARGDAPVAEGKPATTGAAPVPQKLEGSR